MEVKRGQNRGLSEAKVTAIQEAKNLKTLSLGELIGNLQTYELRRNSQQQEETRKTVAWLSKSWRKIAPIWMKMTWLCLPGNSRNFSRRPKLEQGRNNLADSRTLIEISSLGVSSVVR